MGWMEVIRLLLGFLTKAKGPSICDWTSAMIELVDNASLGYETPIYDNFWTYLELERVHQRCWNLSKWYSNWVVIFHWLSRLHIVVIHKSVCPTLTFVMSCLALYPHFLLLLRSWCLIGLIPQYHRPPASNLAFWLVPVAEIPNDLNLCCMLLECVGISHRPNPTNIAQTSTCLRAKNA